MTSTATDLGAIKLHSAARAVGTVGATTTHTVYQVEVTASINLQINLTQLNQNDQVHILYADGTPINNGWQIDYFTFCLTQSSTSLLCRRLRSR